MKKILKLVAVLMIITMAISSMNLSAFAAPVDTKEQEAVRVLKEVYSKLDSEQQEKYVMLLERASSEGNTELLNNHKKYIDKNYKPTGKKLSNREYDVANKIVSAASADYALNFSSMNLPWALSSILYAIGAALNLSWVPTVGQIITIIVGLGAITVFIIYRKEFMANFNSIVNEFKKGFSNITSAIVSAFDKIKAQVNSKDELPLEEEFKDFDRHYNDHAKEFADMPGGNGKKPDKKKYWEMAKAFLALKGGDVVEKVSRFGDTRIKFNSKTFEFMIYNPKTMQIYSYFLPKWQSMKSNGYTTFQWAMKAYQYWQNQN